MTLRWRFRILMLSRGHRIVDGGPEDAGHEGVASGDASGTLSVWWRAPSEDILAVLDRVHW